MQNSGAGEFRFHESSIQCRVGLPVIAKPMIANSTLYDQLQQSRQKHKVTYRYFAVLMGQTLGTKSTGPYDGVRVNRN